MTTTLNGRVQLTVTSTFQNTNEMSTATDPLSLAITQAFTDGTGANKAQIEWHDERVLDGGDDDDIDLAGTVAGIFGTPSFTKVKYMLIRLVTTTSGVSIVVGAAETNPWLAPFGDASDTITITAGGMRLFTDPVNGLTVTGGTGDILRINNPGQTAVTYQIWVAGEGSIA